MRRNQSRYAAMTLRMTRTAELFLSRRLLSAGAVIYLALMTAVWTLLLALWFGGAAGRDRAGSVLGPDFTAFYTGGWLVQHGDYLGLYVLERQASVQRSVLAGFQGVSAYLNPPHYAILLAPLSALPYPLAFAVWTALMVSAFVGTIALLRPVVPALRGPRRWLLTGLLLLSAPVYYAVSAGQNTGLTLVLHAAILVALVRRRDALAGALIAVGMLKPQLFIGLLPLLLLGRRWLTLAGFIAVSGVIAALVVWASGFGAVERWTTLLRSDVYHAEIARQAAKMFSWQSFFTVLLGSGSAATILGWGAALLVFVWLCRVWWREIGDLPLRYSITLLGLMVMGPHLFVYDLGLLILPGLVLTDRLLRAPASDWLWLRLGLLALYVISLFAAEPDLRVGLVVVPLVTAIAWEATAMARRQGVVMQSVGATPMLTHQSS